MLDKIVSFLLGVSWAFLILGAYVTFVFLSSFGLIIAITFTFFFIFIALFMVAVLEWIVLYKKNYEESRKQTKLLRQLHEKLFTS